MLRSATGRLLQQQTRNKMSRLRTHLRQGRFEQKHRTFLVRTMAIRGFEVIRTIPHGGPEPRPAVVGYSEEDDEGT
jgi:hypothetical protein